MKILVTGADGFVGSWLVPHLLEAGHAVVAAVHRRSASRSAGPLGNRDKLGDVPVVEWDIEDPESVDRVAEEPVDAVVHLAAISSGAQAMRDAGRTWEINAAGTARLADAFGRRQKDRGRFLLVSSGEVYGASSAQVPRVESESPAPRSPYGGSKLGAEIAALEVGRRTGLGVIVARPFGHTGPRQDERFVVPAFARRILLAQETEAPAVAVGNLEPIREFMHVADVVEAYRVLLESGLPGDVYNVATGGGHSLRDIFFHLADTVAYKVIPEVDTTLVRSVDLPYLVGDGTKLRDATGWQPRVSLMQTLTEVVDAQTH